MRYELWEMPKTEDVRRIARTGFRETQRLLQTPQARRARIVVATGLIAAAPVIAKHPYVRKTRVFRIVGVAGGAALLVKVAEVIRDWEPRTPASG